MHSIPRLNREFLIDPGVCFGSSFARCWQSIAARGCCLGSRFTLACTKVPVDFRYVYKAGRLGTQTPWCLGFRLRRSVQTFIVISILLPRLSVREPWASRQSGPLCLLPTSQYLSEKKNCRISKLTMVPRLFAFYGLAKIILIKNSNLIMPSRQVSLYCLFR